MQLRDSVCRRKILGTGRIFVRWKGSEQWHQSRQEHAYIVTLSSTQQNAVRSNHYGVLRTMQSIHTSRRPSDAEKALPFDEQLISAYLSREPAAFGNDKPNYNHEMASLKVTQASMYHSTFI